MIIIKRKKDMTEKKAEKHTYPLVLEKAVWNSFSKKLDREGDKAVRILKNAIKDYMKE